MSLPLHLGRRLFSLYTLVMLTLLCPVCVAQFVATDNFNRADGTVGLGWSAWGNGAQITGDQLETFGLVNVAGGIQRKLDVTFPLTFSFDFSTTAPSDGGWQIAFNSGNAVTVGSTSQSEFTVFQNNGGVAVCVFFQTTSGPMDQCAGVVSGQREFTAKAHITGVVNADFSTRITIKYNDGLTPASVTVKTASPAGALNAPVGNLLLLGNPNMTNGPHYFDNFRLALR